MTRKYTSLPWTEKPVADGNFSATGRLPIDTVVWHTAAGTLPGTLGWFNNPASKVSSNYVMDNDGSLYAMLEEYYVPFTNGDWNSNQRSITIETIDDGNPFGIVRTDALYKAAAALTKDICQYYAIPLDRNHVKGHREVSNSHPECPGNLDLDRIVREAQGAPAQPTNWDAIAKESRPFVFGYQTQGTVTQRMAKIIAIYKKYGITSAS